MKGLNLDEKFNALKEFASDDVNKSFLVSTF